MTARKKATLDVVEIHRIEKPGGLVAIYERHPDESVTRRVEKGVGQIDTPAVEGGDVA